MTTKTTPIKSTSTDAILPTETVFTLLSDNRRRYALYYLSQTVGLAVSVDTVIDELATTNGRARRRHRPSSRN